MLKLNKQFLHEILKKNIYFCQVTETPPSEISEVVSDLNNKVDNYVDNYAVKLTFVFYIQVLYWK